MYGMKYRLVAGIHECKLSFELCELYFNNLATL